MQGSVAASRLSIFRDRLSEGSVYTLSGFDVTRSNNNFRLSDAPLAIRFNDATSFDPVTESVSTIPVEFFRLRTYDQLLALANTNRQLPGIFPDLGSDLCSTYIIY